MTMLPSGSKGTAYSTGRIFHYANELQQRAATSQLDAIGAIVFSAIVVEAFMNDLASYTEQFASDTPGFQSLGAQLIKLEGRNVNVIRRVELIWLFVHRVPADFKQPPFSHLDLLIQIRNGLVHLRPTTMVYHTDGTVDDKTTDRFMGEFVRLGIMTKEDFAGSRWPHALENKKIADWAVETARLSINKIIEGLPQGIIKQILEHHNPVSR